MARHRQTPAVARPKGLRRGVELLKDLLIVLLTCSAVFLAWQTPMATHFRGLVTPAPPAAEDSASPNEEALTPYAIRVRNGLGSYGVSYDSTGLERTFQRLSPALGEAFSTASAPVTLTQRRWRTLLEAPGFYCAFQGQPPLSALGAWLGGSESLAGSAQALVLAREGEAVTLAWRDGENYYAAATQVSYEATLSQLLEGFNPNGAAFAYTLAPTDAAYEALDPYVLLPVTAPQPQVYAALSPDFVGNREDLGQLLSALGFLSGADSAYETPGGLTVTENGDRLQVTAAGAVVYRSSGEESRYTVPTAEDRPTAAQAAQTAWELLNRVVEPFDGTPDYVLTGAEETETGWSITFEARLDGIPLSTGEAGWCARVMTEGRKVSEFSLMLRTYSAAGETTLLPSGRLAAAALRSISESDGSLKLRYTDNLSPTLTAGWITGE